MNPQLQQAGNICQHFLADFFFPQSEKDKCFWREGHSQTQALQGTSTGQHPTLQTHRLPFWPSLVTGLQWLHLASRSQKEAHRHKFPQSPGGRKEDKLWKQWTNTFFVLPIKTESKKGMSTNKAKHMQVQLRAFWVPSTFYSIHSKKFPHFTSQVHPVDEVEHRACRSYPQWVYCRYKAMLLAVWNISFPFFHGSKLP